MQSRTFASVSVFNFWQNGFVSELTDIPSVESSVPRSRGLLQAEDLTSDPVAETVHYFWCQKKTFQFQHYVSVLSVVKALEPLSIVIHYSSKPRTSLYYTWLGDLVEALPNIVLDDLAPRIAHYVMYDSRKFEFSHYLSVLSCLHVAGLERVVLHGNVEPSSQWWKHLRVEENVTFSYTDPTNQIYGQNITQFPQHKSDITKFYVLLKYGGISVDPDVYWVNRIPDDILSYDAVLSKDWLKRLDWPDTLNIGVFIAKPNTQFLYNFLRAYRRNYRPYLYIYNGGCVPYKVYEKYPQSLHVDPHLQVLTFGPTYHPTWRSGYLHDSSGNMGNNSFDWRKDTLAVHVTDPKPASEFEGVVRLKRAEGMFADIGRYIIKKALKEDMFGPR
ncbi:uncharacterized protein LOC125384330 [Haliotis rufescens]|uniref:uncharacterized protein LOC125384330 n=1 Tax=Haliotis rufescens TaxID=6454 RepID=UPI00201F69A4|nr:uncharacterized protein LOC125384330 [Haliotis rufescens]